MCCKWHYKAAVAAKLAAVAVALSVPVDVAVADSSAPLEGELSSLPDTRLT